MGVISLDSPADTMAMGELGLDGVTRAVSGVLPTTTYVNACYMALVCPATTEPEAAWAAVDTVMASASLLALMNNMKGLQTLSPSEPALAENSHSLLDLKLNQEN